MCGIVGIINHTETSLDNDLRLMVRSITHRGPDSFGFWECPNSTVMFAHRRLAIQDLSTAGNQPMLSKCGRFSLVFNGELYNFKSVRDELAELGCEFMGYSDTEVLLNACVEWGVESAIVKFKGMFAFAFYDSRFSTLKLVRDRLGEKPLYYSSSANLFSFSSELKAFTAANFYKFHLNDSILPYYLQHGCTPAVDTLYEGINKVEPGTILTVDIRTLQLNKKCYWTAYDIYRKGVENPFVRGEDELLNQLDELLSDSVRMQLISDAPIGCFLSGGIDSSLITALASKVSSSPIKTFSVGFEEKKYDESSHARAISRHLGTEHHEIFCTEVDSLELAPKILEIYDEPFYDPSAIPTVLLSKFAGHHVKVALSGDAGDELFWGYSRYELIKRLWAKYKYFSPFSRKVDRINPQLFNLLDMLPRSTMKLKRALYMAGFNDMYDFYMRSRHSFNAYEVDCILGKESVSSLPNHSMHLGDEFDYIPYLDLVNYLPNDILVKVDRASMYSSLETRVPLLDHNVVEFALCLPNGLKYKRGEGKYLLRKLLEQYVPSHLFERPKKGFGVPLANWLRSSLHDYAFDIMSQARNLNLMNLNYGYLERLLNEHCSGLYDHSTRIWIILLLLQFGIDRRQS